MLAASSLSATATGYSATACFCVVSKSRMRQGQLQVHVDHHGRRLRHILETFLWRRVAHDQADATRLVFRKIMCYAALT